jgi:glycosyltransferase involved in cell wall biosynthesis
MVFLNSYPGARNPRIQNYFLGQRLISRKEWDELRRKPGFQIKELQELPRFETVIAKLAPPILTVIVSLYKSDKYIDEFLKTLKGQTVFNLIEVVIVAVSPSDFELVTLSALNEDPNVQIIKIENRIGIYEAWNLAIKASSAPFITNMNVDDQRHPQSLEVQVSELAISGADVLFQDVYYTYEENLLWGEISSIALKSEFGEVTFKSLLQGYNYPHNAPMWRRDLHREVGWFDEGFVSAGDHDFWIRTALKRKSFVKSEYMHVSYYINPEGISTSLESPGRLEGAIILKKYKGYAT